MPRTRVNWAIAAVAVLLNIVGSPMAWAQWLTAGPTAECHEQSAPDSMPCCQAGDCTCAAPALFIPSMPPSARIPHPAFDASFATPAVPAQLLDDRLRPPIR